MTQASPKVVNIVNFIRNVEPRLEMDLETPVREQMALAKKYNLPTTWLLQYDSLCGDFYVKYLKENMPKNHEVGIWFEIVQEQVEAAGLKWRGRYSWDWHSDKAFSVGYTREERERLVDVMMAKFEEVFGYYPKCMGSWFFDAHLVDYLQNNYGLDAACNCKDQYGTDGYTLWGGYWANAYYPCRNNAYLPAVELNNQIDVPVFRMLGSDPLYQYDADVNRNHGNGQPVITLEPVYTGYEAMPAGGGNPAWCDWFFKENFRDENLNLSYAQAGQENSFGWPKMEVGLTHQYKELAKLRDAGQMEVELLSESGRNFKKRFKMTPVTSVVVREDWRNEGHETLWYLSKLNRLNFFREENGTLVLRDFQIYSDKYSETFLNSVCRSNLCMYDALPVIDGMLWKAAWRFLVDNKEVSGRLGQVNNLSDECVEFEWLLDNNGSFTVKLKPGKIAIDSSKMLNGKLTLEFVVDRNRAAKTTQIAALPSGDGWSYEHNGMRYTLKTTNAPVSVNDNGTWVINVEAQASFEFVIDPYCKR